MAFAIDNDFSFLTAARIKDCYDKGESKFTPCLMEYWLELAKVLAAGIPSLKVPPIDPMAIEDIHIEEQGALVQAKASFSNVIAKGASNYQVKSIVIHKGNHTLYTKMVMPFLQITGLYAINGTIVLLKVDGKGPFSINLTNVVSDVDAHFIFKGGHPQLNKVDVDFKIDIIGVSLKGLLGDDAIAEAVNKMLNDNSQEILDEIRPRVEETISHSILTGFKHAFEEVPKEALGF